MKTTRAIEQGGPIVTLLGAGPGDPELLTVKGLKVLTHAKAILYDALVSDEILRLAPEGIPKITVGKRAGMHTHTQDEINQMIVDYAHKYGHVVRLKGGDPFVFGRGHEELEYAEKHGVHVEVIPGISSALAVPASLRIPLTSRGVSESFWVVTGTTQAGDLSDDIVLAARSTATVVVLMGMRHIREIMEMFAVNGKAETPVAVIQNGTLPSEQWIVATVATIADAVKTADLSSPAVIVVGEVSRYAANVKSAPHATAHIRRTA